ncbi:hypothetical protein AB1K91_17835 [Terribacillus sp. 179-K 1B1 HS]|uniref:hypothetical protein n=1 Tax=Terribacillus sp. 179-K 1B1 HS TaxID=3142388 RepID=UPI0039A1BD40
MLYKVKMSMFNDSVEVGELIDTIDGTRIKVLTIVKVDSDSDGEAIVYVTGFPVSAFE